MKISNAWKTVVAALGSVVTVAAPIVADNVLDWSEAGVLASAIAGGVATVIAVFKVPNAE